MKLERIATICCLLFITQIPAFAQNQGVALLTAECESIRGLCQIQHLVRYRFRNGVMVSRDVTKWVTRMIGWIS